ncbi:MFS transporter [Actinomadura algeriensis]|uniref:DHA2 family multidrug resistance protein-like MFS transporter n=1 Tax=Actinomadura algeriensis TaxID=1679523 RepID=A0ABR9JPD3_9ACTN|nr:MFS transporter [Actinomadura algeriensis]MBE1532430.1 DHA2 family multidrug resistance protein-like MFS transporter [Actinomadura algeriensis]
MSFEPKWYPIEARWAPDAALLALATEPWTFVLARALLGIGGATLAPSTLALIRAMYPDERRRRAAVGAWTVAFTGGSVAGPIVGGFLLEHFWWGSIFLVNVPVMLLLLLVAPIVLDESRDPEGARFDLLGAVLALPAVLGLVLALKRVTGHGADAATVAAALAGLAFAAAFVLRQRRAAHPLIDLGLFRVPAFGAAVTANTVVSWCTAGMGALAFTFMQTVHGLSALEAAVHALPTFAGTVAGAALAGTIADRARPVLLVTAGMLLAALGFGGIALLDPDTSVWAFVGGFTVMTVGVGVCGTTANSLILATAPPGRAGAAAGVSETSTELGAALGIAVLGTAATTVYRANMEDTVPAGAAAETVAAALTDPRLVDAATSAYTGGVTTAAAVSAIVLLPITALTAWALRGSRPS